MEQAIGILGGTFDPIHFGHLRSSLEVMQQLNLQHIRLIPSARPPHRPQPQATPEQRLMMLHLAIKNNQQFVVDDRELAREGDSYTVDTLLSLRQDFPDTSLYLILGTDAFCHIRTWHRWEELLGLSHIVVMQRPNELLDMPEELDNWYQQNLAKDDDSNQVSGKVWPIKVTQLAISATNIRQIIAQNKSPQYLLPDAVIQLIEQINLYQDNS